MPIKFFRTFKQARRERDRVGTPGIALKRTSPIWRRKNKTRTNKNYAVKY